MEKTTLLVNLQMQQSNRVKGLFDLKATYMFVIPQKKITKISLKKVKNY